MTIFLVDAPVSAPLPAQRERRASRSIGERIRQGVTTKRLNERIARRRSARVIPTAQENQKRSLQRAMQCSDAEANVTAESAAQDSCGIWGASTASTWVQTVGIATSTV